MRGNALLVIDELTLSGGLNFTSGRDVQVHATSDLDDDQDVELNVASTQQQQQLNLNASRLIETYPELINSLIGPSPGDDSDARQMLLQLASQFGHNRLIASINNNNNNNNADPLDDEELAASSSSSAASASGPEEFDEEVNEVGVPEVGLNHQQPKYKLSDLKQLQELDLGECQLTYIKWNTFARLSSLKRLQLDGNHLR